MIVINKNKHCKQGSSRFPTAKESRRENLKYPRQGKQLQSDQESEDDYDHQDWQEGCQQDEDPYNDKERHQGKRISSMARNREFQNDQDYDSIKERWFLAWKKSRWRREHRDTNIKMTEKGIDKKKINLTRSASWYKTSRTNCQSRDKPGYQGSRHDIEALYETTDHQRDRPSGWKLKL